MYIKVASRSGRFKVGSEQVGSDRNKSESGRFKSGRIKVRFASFRFKVQGMTDTRWLTYNLTSPAAACCC